MVEDRESYQTPWFAEAGGHRSLRKITDTTCKSIHWLCGMAQLVSGTTFFLQHKGYAFKRSFGRPDCISLDIALAKVEQSYEKFHIGVDQHGGNNIPFEGKSLDTQLKSLNYGKDR